MQNLTEQNVMPADGNVSRHMSTPVGHQRTMRVDHTRTLSSTFGGKFFPAFAIPLLREDAMGQTPFRFAIEMAETASMLMNPVRVRCRVWYVSRLSFERFTDVANINRAYVGQQEKDGLVTPLFVHGEYWDPASGGLEPHEFYRALGKHIGAGQTVNEDYLRAYNAIWNKVAHDTSPAITPRAEDDKTLAPAFWQHSLARHIVPDFDDAMIDGEISLSIANPNMPVKGLGTITRSGVSSQSVYQTGEAAAIAMPVWTVGAAQNPSDVWAMRQEVGTSFPLVEAELQQDGVKISLANIDVARDTAAMARLRQKYSGVGDDDLIDLMMSGIRIPEQAMRDPILIGENSTTFGMSQRYATDGASLETSVTTGQTILDVRAGVPVQNTGGIVMGTVEILPEQLWERQRDYYLAATSVDQLPDRIRDEFDPQPVEVIRNEDIDTDHSDPSGLFGYAPINSRWQRQVPAIGGNYYRARHTDPWTEWRNRIWTVEVEDPALGPDFYLSESMQHDVFAAGETVEPFEVMVSALPRISGLTYFGPKLMEASDDYEKVLSGIDLGRIDKANP